MGCILPMMHCRSQHCWDLLHPFVHHHQYERNIFRQCWPNKLGSCCVRLHVALDNSEPNKRGDRYDYYNEVTLAQGNS